MIELDVDYCKVFDGSMEEILENTKWICQDVFDPDISIVFLNTPERLVGLRCTSDSLFMEEDEVLDRFLGKFYAYNMNPTRWKIGHSMEEPPKIRKNSIVARSYVSAYIHGAIHLARSGTMFHDPFDSGIAGEIIITTDDLRECFSKTEWRKLSRDDKKRIAIKKIDDWLEEYTCFLNGYVHSVFLISFQEKFKELVEQDVLIYKLWKDYSEGYEVLLDEFDCNVKYSKEWLMDTLPDILKGKV